MHDTITIQSESALHHAHDVCSATKLECMSFSAKCAVSLAPDVGLLSWTCSKVANNVGRGGYGVVSEIYLLYLKYLQPQAVDETPNCRIGTPLP